MTDRRFHPANARVAHVSLRGAVEGLEFVQGDIARVLWPIVDLARAPDGARDKQLLQGQPLRVLERHDGWAFVQDVVDDYVGYVPEAAVGAAPAPTHRVGVRMAHVYSAPDMKSPETGLLSFMSEVTAAPAQNGFHALEGGGYMATQHLVAFTWRAGDPVAMAEMFLGTPYLWGGNSGLGIDCSGLVQMAWYAHGWGCPRDSDLQASLGHPLPEGAPLRRGDLVHWKGHVGIMADADTLLHANAHHMAVAREPLDGAIARIAQKEFGDVTTIRRMGGTDE